MDVQAEKLKLEAWKVYTGLGLGADKEGWWLDDEKVSYPALETARRLKIKNICTHKGLALGLFNEAHCHPKDLVKVSKDFSDMNFLVYHSGFKALEAALPAAEDGFKKNPYVPWVSDPCEMRKKSAHMTNVYMELGSTFGLMAVTQPMLCCHVLGMILDAFGPDHVLWGTDSVWWGSPQWQIEALRRLEMPAQSTKQFGYKPLTHEVKAQIFGLNAARIYHVDPKARRNGVPADYIDRLKQLYKQAGGPMPSNIIRNMDGWRDKRWGLIGRATLYRTGVFRPSEWRCAELRGVPKRLATGQNLFTGMMSSLGSSGATFQRWVGAPHSRCSSREERVAVRCVWAAKEY